jgi:serine/threonine-protein kinase
MVQGEGCSVDDQAQPLGSRYLLDEPIGHGAMGTVWRGRLKETDERVAVKLLRPELAAEPEVVARFVQERSVLLKLRHPHLVPVRDLVIEGTALALVMELIDGDDLRTHLRRKGTTTPGFAATVVSQIADALVAVHAERVVHRDLKPANVLLERAFGDKAPRARLTDFGVARVLDGPGLTSMTSLIGTPEYLAPEVIDGGEPTPAADVYAAGVMLYELVGGRSPYAGGHPMAVLRRHSESTPRRIPGCPPQLWRLIERCLAKDPAARPTAAELSTRLRQMGGFLVSLPALDPLPALGEEPASGAAYAPEPPAKPRSVAPILASRAPAAAAAAAGASGPASRAHDEGQRPVEEVGEAAHVAPDEDLEDRPRRLRLLVGAAITLGLAAGALAASGVFSDRSDSGQRPGGGHTVVAAPGGLPTDHAVPALASPSAIPVDKLLTGHTMPPTTAHPSTGAARVTPGASPSGAPVPPGHGSPTPTTGGGQPSYTCLPAYHYATKPKVGVNACYATNGTTVSVITMAVGPVGTKVDLRSELHNATTGKLIGASHVCKNVVLAPDAPQVCGPFAVKAVTKGQQYSPEAGWKQVTALLWTTVLGPLLSL